MNITVPTVVLLYFCATLLPSVTGEMKCNLLTALCHITTINNNNFMKYIKFEKLAAIVIIVRVVSEVTLFRLANIWNSS